ncbi:MAG TPA: inositol monophosphatase family protein [Pseudonocardia sp.]|nr:inositol monophosphatase family protein [Pseudonocardia sp.]
MDGTGTAATAARLRSVAEAVAGDAAAHLRDLPPPTGATATKSSPTDVVTAADTAVETLVRDRLAALRPGEPVVGEEAGGSAGTADVAWVVDPIDGTVNYLYGLPWYAVSVAAVQAGRTVAGAVAEPASGRLWSAARGGGATCDGRALRVSTATDTALALVGTGFSYRADRRARQALLLSALLPRVRDVRRAGSAALDLCAVAAGWLDGYAEHGTNWWDWAAAALIAEEAGAVVRVPGPPGTEPPEDGLGDDLVLAAAPGVAAGLAGMLRELGAADV